MHLRIDGYGEVEDLDHLNRSIVDPGHSSSRLLKSDQYATGKFNKKLDGIEQASK